MASNVPVVVRVPPGHGTFSAALGIAASGCTLSLCEGEYTESRPCIIATSGIRVKGIVGSDGVPRSRVSAASSRLGSPLIQVRADLFSMEGVCITLGTADDAGAADMGSAANKDCALEKCVQILSGGSSIMLTACAIQCHTGIGIEIGGWSSPVIDGCTIKQGTWWASPSPCPLATLHRGVDAVFHTLHRGRISRGGIPGTLAGRRRGITPLLPLGPRSSVCGGGWRGSRLAHLRWHALVSNLKLLWGRNALSRLMLGQGCPPGRSARRTVPSPGQDVPGAS